MNNNVGKEIIVDGAHVGKVIAEPTEGYYKDAYLVLLNKEGKKVFYGWSIGLIDAKIKEGRKLFCGWNMSSTDYREVKKACGKYDNDPNNRLYFFSKKRSVQLFEGVVKVLTNE